MAATPGRPGLFLGHPLGSPETPCRGRPGAGLGHVCAFYSMLLDQMSQEPSPVHKDGIKLMKKKACTCRLRPTRRGSGVLGAAALFLEKKQLPESRVWTCQQQPREPATPPPRGLGSASLMSQSLIGRTWFPPSSSKFQGNAETSRVSTDETARGTGSRLLSAGLRSGGGRSEGFAYTVPSAWKAPPHPRLILQAVASAASATPAGPVPDRPPADLPAGSGPPVTPSPGCP